MQKLNRFILTLLLFLTPIFVYASGVDPDYKVVDAYIGANIDITGSLHIKEAIIIKGSLNGYRREIEYKNDKLKEWEEGKIDFANSSFYNARGVSLSKVSAEKIDKEDIGWDLLSKSYEKFEEQQSAKLGDMSSYTLEKTNTGVNIKTYNMNESGYMVFFYEYYIDQAAVLHNDIGELYFTFFKLDTDDVEKVNIQVTAPGVSTKDTFRFWAHGALNGEIKAISEKKDELGNYLYGGVLATLENYKAGDSVEVRMTFDKRLLGSFEHILNNSKVDALDEIIKVETERSDAANKKRTFIKVVYYTMTTVGFAYLIGLVVLWILMYFRYDKEHKGSFDIDYYRDFIEEYDVEVVEYLMKKEITPNAMNASIMNLIYKHNIDIEENPDDKKNITLVYKNSDNVNDSEKILLELLFDLIGESGRVSLKEIDKYSKKYTTAEKFMKKYNSWHLSAMDNAKKENFYENHTTARALATLYFVLGFIIFGLLLMFNIENYLLIILIPLLAVAFLIYVWTFKKWTVRGRDHYLKWSAFKKFLLDFGSFSDKEIPEIKLWDKYLVYATVLGVAKEVEKAMKVRLSTMDDTSDAMVTNTFYGRDFYIYNTLNNSISNIHTNCANVINKEVANSSMSSGSGFGGGFSGGGGFAGGGGGGGGF